MTAPISAGSHDNRAIRSAVCADVATRAADLAGIRGRPPNRRRGSASPYGTARDRHHPRRRSSGRALHRRQGASAPRGPCDGRAPPTHRPIHTHRQGQKARTKRRRRTTKVMHGRSDGPLPPRDGHSLPDAGDATAVPQGRIEATGRIGAELSGGRPTTPFTEARRLVRSSDRLVKFQRRCAGTTKVSSWDVEGRAMPRRGGSVRHGPLDRSGPRYV